MIAAIGRRFEPSERDQTILRDLLRVRLLTGSQLERLHFADLATANARGSARRRSLGRLADLLLVTTLPRQVGGQRAGSAGLVYALDSAAYRCWPLWLDQAPQQSGRVRRPWVVGWSFVQHTLEVAELYVRLRERERSGQLRLISFEAEPVSWYGGLKPDAYAVFETAAWEEHRWIEVDRATESLPTVRRKLAAYLQLVRAGDIGPRGVLPKVLVTVPTVRRASCLRQLIARLPAPADRLFAVEVFSGVYTARPPPG